MGQTQTKEVPAGLEPALPGPGTLASKLPRGVRAVNGGGPGFTAALLIVLLSSLLPTTAHGQFNVATNNGTITIVKYTGAGGVVSIPGTITGLPVTAIGSNAFLGNFTVTGVIITNTVTSIGDTAFDNCQSLSSVTIPNSITNLGNGTFESCPALTNAAIPNSITNIGTGLFYSCSSLRNVIIPDSVVNIGSTSFESCTAVTNVSLGSNVTNIDTGAFENCTSLARINLPGSVTNLGGQAFENCGKLTSLAIPGSVLNIGGEAFADCTALTNLSISNGVAGIGDYAFTFCGHLTNVAIPRSVTNIGIAPFSACSNLTAITVDPLNPAYSSITGALYNANQSVLIQVPSGYAGEYLIPNGVVSIGIDAFDECSLLTNVVIPATVGSIGDYGFYFCTRLAGVYFEGAAPTLGMSVFTGDGLATVYYLPGNGGWSSPFGGLTAVAWNAQIQTNGPSFGVQTNRFGFLITGSSNLVDVVEACTNPANPVWLPLQTNALNGGSFYFSDPQWTNFPMRFYKLGFP